MGWARLGTKWGGIVAHGSECEVALPMSIRESVKAIGCNSLVMQATPCSYKGQVMDNIE